MYKASLLIALLVAALLLPGCQGKPAPETITFPSSDGVTITADLYPVKAKDAPYIILFHQAGSSRGEYLEIAPKLNKLGFNCLAVDQRSGLTMNKVENETHKDAERLGKGTDYLDALDDLEAALAYVRDELKAERIILWGSSYSASLAFVLGQKFPQDISGILAFSPGEYFPQIRINQFAQDVTCPVFITSAQNEAFRYQTILASLASYEKIAFVPSGVGSHGSSALWEAREGHEAYWQAVETFLAQFIGKTE